jgi:hypothetical protein
MTNEENLYELTTKLLEEETSAEMLNLKRQLFRRIINESDIKPSRIPAPLNITEIGGYFNLMMKMRQEETLKQTSTLKELVKKPADAGLNKQLNEALMQERAFSDMLIQTLSLILGLPVKPPIDE